MNLKRSPVALTKIQDFKNIGNIFFWSAASKARLLADALVLVFFVSFLGCLLLSHLHAEVFNLYSPTLQWTLYFSAFNTTIFLLISIWAKQLEKRQLLQHKGPLLAILVAIPFCLSSFFSTIGIFDGFTWFVIFVFTSVGFVVTEPKYIFRTQFFTVVFLILFALSDPILPYSVRAYIIGDHSSIDTFKTVDLWFTWLLMGTCSLIGTLMLGFLTSVWQKRENKLILVSQKDSLTEIMNRRSIMEFAEEKFNQSKREKEPNSVAILDLDHFKNINDNFGHPFGDQALKFVAEQASSHIRKKDAVGRLGGEEFILIFDKCSQEEAALSLNRLRQKLHEAPLQTDKGDQVAIRFSAGVSQIRELDTDIKDVISRADKALYQAKDAGRNQVQMAK